MSCNVGEVMERLENEQSSTFPSLHLRHSSFSNPSVALPTSQLNLQPFRCFIYVTAHSPTLLSLLLRHRELILYPFRHFTYVTTHSLTLPLLHLRHSSFSNLFASSTSQRAHYPSFPPLHLRHISISNGKIGE